VANVCLVVPRAAAAQAVSSPWSKILALTRGDPLLGERLATARPAAPAVVLGPMAVDVARPGVPGMLLAGDAAGFVDPMTGDGLRLAIDGALLAANVADDVLAGRRDVIRAPEALAVHRRAAFHAKWRFDRVLRRVVDHPEAVRAAAWAAGVWPRAFAAMIRYAGDVRGAA
jgi:flavin-dependent dehydrogenase